MKRLGILICGALSLVLAASGGAPAQTLKDIQGAWTLEALFVEAGDKKIEPYGRNPKGMQIFDPSGRFSIIVFRAGLPKVASNNRETSTPEENATILRGMIAYFGTYTFNEAVKMLTIKIENVSFTNWEGVEQKRLVSVAGDVMTVTNPTVSSGAGVAKIVWKRAK